MAFCYQNSVIYTLFPRDHYQWRTCLLLQDFLFFFFPSKTAFSNIVTDLVRKADSVASFISVLILASVSISWEHVSWCLLVLSEVAAFLATTEAVASHHF